MKKIFLLILFFLILIGCTSKVTEEDLIGGTWEATAGFEDGEAKGEPYYNPFEEGAFCDANFFGLGVKNNTFISSRFLKRNS